MKYSPDREVEEVFKIEETACTNRECYENTVRGLERNVGLRLGGSLCARFRHLDFTPKAMEKYEGFLGG